MNKEHCRPSILLRWSRIQQNLIHMIRVILHNVNLAVPVAHRPGIQIIIWTNNHDIDLLDFVFVYQLTEISVDVFVYQLTEISVDVFVYQLTEISVVVFAYQLTEISVVVFVYPLTEISVDVFVY